jgi:hypothetical protein
MTYLYAGLGMAMLAAIVAMVEMAMSITGQQLQSRPPQDPYFEIGAASADQQLLRLIHSPDTEGGLRDFRGEIASICGDSGAESLAQRIQSNRDLYPALMSYRFEPVALDFSDLSVGCAGMSGRHRVIIVPVGDQFSIYSCALTSDAVCPFEHSDDLES